MLTFRFPSIMQRALALSATVSAAATLLFSAPQAAPDLWKIDVNHSAAYFSVRHLMISTVRGEFNGMTGAVHYDPNHINQASVDASIDCRTLNTGVAKRDEQMKGPDFFDTKKYPFMKFRSKRVDPAGPDHLKITGDLTINATTRQVVLDVDGPSAPIKDAQGRTKIGMNATTKINRKDFGIVWNEVLESGGVAVADQVTINLDVELIKGQ